MNRPGIAGPSWKRRIESATRRIVAVAGGAVKVDAIRAVLASGLLNGLITDEATAGAVLKP